MGRVTMDEAAKLRQGGNVPSRAACWTCGLPPDATCHTDEDRVWFLFHVYVPAILTKLPERADG